MSSIYRPVTKQAWWDDAACAGMDVNIFFQTYTKKGCVAMAICNSCPVIFECRAATDKDEQHLRRSDIMGIFGGETPRQRLRRRAIKAQNGEGTK